MKPEGFTKAHPMRVGDKLEIDAWGDKRMYRITGCTPTPDGYRITGELDEPPVPDDEGRADAESALVCEARRRIGRKASTSIQARAGVRVVHHRATTRS